MSDHKLNAATVSPLQDDEMEITDEMGDNKETESANLGGAGDEVADPKMDEEDKKEEEEEEEGRKIPWRDNMTPSEAHEYYMDGHSEEDSDEAPEDRIDRLDTEVFTGVGEYQADLIKQQLGEDCAICHEPIVRPTVFPECSHVFCGICAIKAARDKRECPYCGDSSTLFVWQLVLLDVQLA